MVVIVKISADTVSFTLGLHYRGMKSRLIKACGVTDINTTVVYSEDTFEWRGQLTLPFYIKSNTSGDMVGAFSVAILKNGVSV
jgi:recombinational DNA repair protein RecT